MAERERVIKGLESLHERLLDAAMWDSVAMLDALMVAGALYLLKEQEAVKPEVYYVGEDKYKFYRCPVCKTAWYYKGNYCLGCGRSVKWE